MANRQRILVRSWSRRKENVCIGRSRFGSEKSIMLAVKWRSLRSQGVGGRDIGVYDDAASSAIVLYPRLVLDFLIRSTDRT